MVWTQFWDMHSGGDAKLPWLLIYIEAPKEEAIRIVKKRFNLYPDNVTCECCGEDYAIREGPTLKAITGFHRGCRSLRTPRDPKTGLFRNDLHKTDPIFAEHFWLERDEEPPHGYEADDEFPPLHPYLTLDEFIARPDVLIIQSKDLEP